MCNHFISNIFEIPFAFFINRLEELGLIKQCEIVEPQTYEDELFLVKHTEKLLENLKHSATLSHDQFPEFSSRWDSVYFNEVKIINSFCLILILQY